MHVCVFIYTHNKCTQYMYIYYVNKLLFWMWINAINRLTALVKSNREVKSKFNIRSQIFQKMLLKINIHLIPAILAIWFCH